MKPPITTKTGLLSLLRQRKPADFTRNHEKEEGYGTGDGRATLVCRIPRTLSVRKGWPGHDMLRALGAVFLSETTPHVVEIRSTVYQEGGMDAVINRLSDDYAEAAGMGRLNKTTRLQ